MPRSRTASTTALRKALAEALLATAFNSSATDVAPILHGVVAASSDLLIEIDELVWDDDLGIGDVVLTGWFARTYPCAPEGPTGAQA